jgi:uncharacterized protein with PhoU and TrkA domain
MTVAEKIAGLENRVEQLRLQMKRLLQVASNEAQKEAVTLGHQMTIGEFQERIDALKNGEPDPWE